MSTLDSASALRHGQLASNHLRTARNYLVAALGCALFAFIYAQFSHGIYSPFMTFMFAIPLVGGALVKLIMHLAKMPDAPLISKRAWALCIASLTIASCLQGVFEIAGTDSPYLIVYLIFAAACAIVAIAGFIARR